MSMLAERKTKQKWTLNPRGKYWSDDNNKFGQRMLEKMGWSAGKGLGAKENGITEHIKQSYKNDTKGVGFEDREDQWTRHESDFSNLLQSLGTEIEVKKPETSLEKKSQISRKRVHYHKFTRGKDLSRYSEKDLANIFGRKTLEKKEKIETTNEDESNSNSNSSESKEFGVITVNSGSMTDYFKTKLKTGFSNPMNEDHSDDERPAFGFGFAPTVTSSNNMETKETNTFTSKFMSMFTKSTENTLTGEKAAAAQENKSDNVQDESKEKSKKKKNKTKVVINECFDNPGFADFPDSTIQDEVTEDCTKKKKKKPKDLSETGLQNDAFEDFTPEPVKKSKKRKLETIIEESTIENESANNDNQTIEPAKKKSKKQKTKYNNEFEVVVEDSKKNQKIGIDNVACTELGEDNLTFEDSETKSKKKKKEEAVGICNMGCTELDNENSEESKKNKKKESAGICNLGCTELDKENVEESDVKSSAKKKKKRAVEVGIYNVACTEDLKNDLQEPAVEPQEQKSAKKKRKNKDDLGISNPACTENSNDSITLEEDDTSVPSSVKKSKKKKAKDTGVDNVACTANSVQQNIEEAISSMSNAIDDYQLELENQMNEKKAENKTEIQDFVPKFKSNRNFHGVRKSVKHVIKGDLRYEFEGSNLPQIPGYGVER